MKAIAWARIKTDKRDSVVLAHLLRMKMVPKIYWQSQENRKAQRILRQRSFYGRAPTALTNLGPCVSLTAEGGVAEARAHQPSKFVIPFFISEILQFCDIFY